MKVYRGDEGGWVADKKDVKTEKDARRRGRRWGKRHLGLRHDRIREARQNVAQRGGEVEGRTGRPEENR